MVAWIIKRKSQNPEPKNQVAYLRFVNLGGGTRDGRDLLFHALLLLGILWFSVILLTVWPRRQATTHHDDCQPTEPHVRTGAEACQGFSLCPAAADRLHTGLPTQGAYRAPFLPATAL
jgi:hypothetical protein